MEVIAKRRVFIAIDRNKANSERAFQYYLEKMHSSGDQVLLAHIVEPPQIPPPTLAYYLEKMHSSGDQVLLAHIVEPPQIPPPTLASGPSRSKAEWEKLISHMTEVAREVTIKYEEHLEDLKNRLRQDIPYKTIWAAGTPGQSICDLADDERADIIIMGNRGMGTIRRTLLGSVTDYVVQHSQVAVLVVPPSWHTREMEQQCRE